MLKKALLFLITIHLNLFCMTEHIREELAINAKECSTFFTQSDEINADSDTLKIGYSEFLKSCSDLVVIDQVLQKLNTALKQEDDLRNLELIINFIKKLESISRKTIASEPGNEIRVLYKDEIKAIVEIFQRLQ